MNFLTILAFLTISTSHALLNAETIPSRLSSRQLSSQIEFIDNSIENPFKQFNFEQNAQLSSKSKPDPEKGAVNELVRNVVLNPSLEPEKIPDPEHPVRSLIEQVVPDDVFKKASEHNRTSDVNNLLPDIVLHDQHHPANPEALKNPFTFLKDGFNKFFGEQIPEFLQVTLAESINVHLIDRVIDAIGGSINKLVGKILKTLEFKADGAVYGVFNLLLEQTVGRKWPGESIGFIKKHVYQPLKDKATHIVEEFSKRVVNLLNGIVEGAQSMVVDDIKKSMKRFFGLGRLRKHRPISVNITHTGIQGFIQKKLEQVHSDVYFEMKPSVVEFMLVQQNKILSFVRETISDILYTILGSLRSNKVVVKIVDWISDHIRDLFTNKVATSLAEFSKKATVELDKGLRVALYAVFGFLKEDLARINGAIVA